MPSFFRRKPAEPPLAGAPAVRRLKTYSAASGYVYQYVYDGRRPASRAGAPGVQFVFQVSADRRSYFPLSVFLPETSVSGFERPFSGTEHYAIAKLALFRAFDERETPGALAAEAVVTREAVVEIVETLGLLS